ncbi:MAG: hypothetical protein R6V10_15370 [bacterium]
MAYKVSSYKKVIMMSKELMDLYDFCPFPEGAEFQPITFHAPQECLEMLVSSEDFPYETGEEDPLENHKKVEKQWGELELRLSFFTDALHWQ